MEKMNWIQYFQNLVDQVKVKSKDRNFKVGAIIVGEDNAILSTGYNSFPRGINDNVEERQLKPDKYFWIEHAERNAIFNAAKNGIKLDGAKIFLTSSYPCADCARAIINCGIKSIYCYRSSGPYNDHWNKHYEVSKKMLDEASVDVLFYEDSWNSQ